MKSWHIKPITPQDNRSIRTLAKKVFGWGVGLFIPTKHLWGFYVEDGHHIIAAVLMEKVSKNEGILSWVFVDEKARGYRLASQLIERAVTTMDEAGLTTQFACVRDDNTSSWSMFYKKGYKVLPLFHTLFRYSIKSLMYRVNYAMVSGYSIWVKDEKKATVPTYPRFPIIRTLLSSLILGGSLALFGLRSFEFLFVALITVIGLTLGRMLVSFIIARRYGPLRWMPSQGGFLLSLLIALMTSAWFPNFGFFVPKADIWNIKDFNRYVGHQSFASWFLLIVAFIGVAYSLPTYFEGGLNLVLMLVLLYQIPIAFPFDSFDGSKVWRWNKLAYFVALLLSIGSIILFF
jgi:GNAT superfamily N-acetyltransferase